MKKSLKNKVLIGVPVIFITVMLIVIIVVSVLLSKQSRKVADTLIHNTFNIIRYNIAERQGKLLFDSRQMATLNDMGGKIKYVTEIGPHFKYDAMKPTYVEIATQIYDIGSAANVWRASVYNINGELIAFAIIGEDRGTLGCVHNLETIRIASLGPQEKITDELWTRQNSLLAGIEYNFGKAIPSKQMVRFEVVDGSLCLVAYIPVMGKEYSSVSEKMEEKQVGIIVTVRKFSDTFVRKISELTGTEVNIFTSGGIVCSGTSGGVYANYKTFDLSRFADVKGGRGLMWGPVILRDVTIAGCSYYQGVLPVYSDSKCVAAIVSLYSKELARADTMRVIKLLSMVYFVIIVLIAPITILMVVRGVINPIGKIASMMREVTYKKDFTLKVRTQDEIGDLALSFNAMVDNLRKTTTSIDNLNREIAERKKTEDTLRKSEEFTRRIIESSDECIKVLDLEGRLLSMSGGGQKLLEVDDVTPFLNTSFIDFWKGKEREGCLAAIAKAKQGDTGTFYGYFPTAEGTPKWWEIIVSPIKNPDGSISRLLAVSRDITERKQAEEEIRKSRKILQDMIDAMPFGVVVVGKDKKIRHANVAVQQLTCYSESELVGHLCHRTLCPADENDCPIFDKNQTVDNSERKLITRDGKEIPILKSVVKMEMGDEEVLLEAFADITKRKEAEKALRESENKYRVLMENIPQKVFVKDRNSVYISCNENYALDLKIKPEEIAGKTDYDFYPKEFAEKYRADDQRIIESGRTESIEEKYIQNERELLVCTVKTPVRDDSKNVVGILGIFWDITERKKAEEKLRKAEEKYRMQFEGALDAIFVRDAETGIIIDCNTAATKLVGWEKSELIGQHQRILHPLEEVEGEFSKSFKYFKQHLKENQGLTFETRVITKEGKMKDVVITANLFEINGKKVLQSIFHDITERKEAEETTKRLNMDLRDTIVKLGRANDELKDFVYIASHDLREPLRKISAFGELLAASLKDRLSSDDKENLGFMTDGAKRMQEMIDALLTYSRVTTKETAFEAVDLNKVVKALREVELAVKIEETGAEIVVPEPLHVVNGDPAQVRQLIQNFIANALKFQKKGAVPHITIRSSTADNNMARVEVADNGIGIKQEYFKNIFIMFGRLHSRQEYEGSGIGLAVCKKIIERHGGDIGVSSTYGEGSTFWFTLPLVRPSEKKQVGLTSVRANV